MALGLEPPSLLIQGGRVFSVYTGELLEADVAVCGEMVAGVGSYPAEAALEVVDARGLIVIPGLVDAHVHVESSLLSPRRFAAALAPHGVTTVMAEPHELTNVLGVSGVEYFLAARKGLPVDLQLMLPSSVPASPYEAGAARLTPEDIAALLPRPGVQGLGEVMDYPAVLDGGSVWRTLEAAAGRVRDGHAPGLTGRELSAYLAGGMRTDHETADPALLLERRRLGMWLLAREGTAARDLERVIPFLQARGLARTALCTDDRHAATLLEEHHIDGMVGRLTAAGLPLHEVLAAASLAAAELFRLFDRGGVAPGQRADLSLVEDPAFPHPAIVLQAGRVVARDDVLTALLPENPPLPPSPVRIHLPEEAALAPLLGQGDRWARAIRLLPGALATDEARVKVRLHNGQVEAAGDAEVALIALLERHRGTGQIGTGLVTGLGLRTGALASTVAHDSHHLIVAGTNVRDMAVAVRAVAQAGGGLAVASGSLVRVLPLPLAGLMSDDPAEDVAAELRTLEQLAASLGCRVPGPFMALSFLSLSVIPRLKITVEGLLDVERGTHVPVVLE